MSDRKWLVTLKVDEEVVREFHEQGPGDPDTTESDVRDALGDIIGDGGASIGLWRLAEAADKRGIQIVEAREA